jgi:hypothetical protein
MEKIQADCEAVMSNMQKILSILDTHGDVMKKLPGHVSRLTFYRNIDAIVANLQETHAKISAGLAMRSDEQHSRKPRMPVIPPAADVSSEERVKQLEDMLRVSPCLREQVGSRDSKSSSSDVKKML